MYTTKDRRNAIKQNLDDAEDFKAKLEKSKTEMKQMQNETMENLKAELESHRNATKNLKEKYKKDSDKLIANYIHTLEEQSKIVQERFRQMKRSNRRIFDETSKNIQRRIRIRKERNLMHRITLMQLFTDYCDAKMYFSFKACNINEIPTLSDNFQDILEKIHSLKIAALTTFSTTGTLIYRIRHILFQEKIALCHIRLVT